jgi:linoleoyl-CoA desaturase
VTAVRFEPETGESFYRVLRRRVNDYFASAGKTRMADRTVLAKAAALIALLVGSYALVLLHPWPNWTLLPLGCTFGLAALLLVINVGHEAAHRTLFRSRLANDAVLALAFAPIGLSGYLWKMRHTKSHHLFPNVSHAHYQELARLVEETAAECGVRYNRLGTAAIVRSHFRFLRELGRRPETVGA